MEKRRGCGLEESPEEEVWLEKLSEKRLRVGGWNFRRGFRLLLMLVGASWVCDPFLISLLGLLAGCRAPCV